MLGTLTKAVVDGCGAFFTVKRNKRVYNATLGRTQFQPIRSHKALIRAIIVKLPLFSILPMCEQLCVVAIAYLFIGLPAAVDSQSQGVLLGLTIASALPYVAFTLGAKIAIGTVSTSMVEQLFNDVYLPRLADGDPETMTLIVSYLDGIVPTFEFFLGTVYGLLGNLALLVGFTAVTVSQSSGRLLQGIVVGVALVMIMSTFLSRQGGRLVGLHVKHVLQRVKLSLSLFTDIVGYLSSFELTAALYKRTNDAWTAEHYVQRKQIMFGVTNGIVIQSQPIIVLVFAGALLLALGEDSASFVPLGITLLSLIDRPFSAMMGALGGLIATYHFTKSLVAEQSEAKERVTFHAVSQNAGVDADCVFGWGKQTDDSSATEEVEPPPSTGPAGRRGTLSAKADNTSLSVRCVLGPTEYFAIIGSSNAGKSTVLKLLVQLVPPRSGRVVRRGSLSYVPQVPFVIHGSLLSNITFGLPEDVFLLERTIDATMLNDVGELTRVVSAGGVEISSGQRARLGIARACYAQRQIFAADSPLDALDARVSSAVVRMCFTRLLGRTMRIISASSPDLLGPQVTLQCTVDLPMSSFELVDPSVSPDATTTSGLGATVEQIQVVKPREVLLSRSVWELDRDTDEVVSLRKSLLRNAEVIGRAPFFVYGAILGFSSFITTAMYYVVDFAALPLNAWVIVASLTIMLCTLASLVVYSGQINMELWIRRKWFSYILKAAYGSSIVRLQQVPTQRHQTIFRFHVDRVGQVFSSLGMSVNTFIRAGFFSLSGMAKQPILAPVSALVLGAHALIGSYVLPYSAVFAKKSRKSHEQALLELKNLYEGSEILMVWGRSESAIEQTREIVQRNIDMNISATIFETGTLFAVSYLTSHMYIIAVALCHTWGLLTPGQTQVLLGMHVMTTWNLVYFLADSFGLVGALDSIAECIDYAQGLNQEGDSLDLSRNGWLGGLKVDQLCCSYGGDVVALDKVTLNALPFSSLAIIGRTGSGKTTLLKVLAKASTASVTSGTYWVDGSNCTSVAQRYIRLLFSYVPPDACSMPGTVWDNIAYASSDEDTIRKYATLVGLLDEHDPDWKVLLQTTDQDDLSDAEKQLVSIARTMMLHGPIVLFDECTSKLDDATDERIQPIIQAEVVATTLFVHHKPQALLFVERVMELAQGVQVDEGPLITTLSHAPPSSLLSFLWSDLRPKLPSVCETCDIRPVRARVHRKDGSFAVYCNECVAQADP
jgi:ABC-type multidrug transport system fused ATPase/permease subunit